MPLRLMCVLAHPDDESLGTGGTLAKYAGEGVETYVLTATRGERGRFLEGIERPAPEVVGATREAELHAAARELGVRETTLLEFPDGGLDAVDPARVQRVIVDHLHRIRPQVVVTFGPDGAYGHPDHVAISQFATAAIVAAAHPDLQMSGPAPDADAHAVSKFYYLTWPAETWDAYHAAIGVLRATVDGVERQAVPWPDWMITTMVDTRDRWSTAWQAVSCHQSQVSAYQRLRDVSAAHHEALWGRQSYYRVFSTVNGGRGRETDLFDGLP